MFDWKITTLPYFDFKTPSIILANTIDDVADASNVVPDADTSVASANPEPEKESENKNNNDNSNEDPIDRLDPELQNLSNTDNFKQGSKQNGLTHIFKGDSNGTKAAGYHYEGFEEPGTGIIPGTKSQPDTNGIYQANVTVKGVKKNGITTFFPAEWTPQQVVDAVNEAYNNKIPHDTRHNTYIGKTQTGIEIEMVLRKDRIISAYPYYTP